MTIRALYLLPIMAGCLLAAPEDSLQKAEKLMHQANRLEQKGFLYAATQTANSAKEAMVKLKGEYPDFRSSYVDGCIEKMTAKAEAFNKLAEAAPADLPKETKLPECFVAPSEERKVNKMDDTVQRMYTGPIALTSRGETPPVVLAPVRGEKYVPGVYTTRSQPQPVVQPGQEMVVAEEEMVEVTPPWTYQEQETVVAPAPVAVTASAPVVPKTVKIVKAVPATAVKPAATVTTVVKPVPAPVAPSMRAVETTNSAPPSGSGRMTGRSRF